MSEQQPPRTERGAERRPEDDEEIPGASDVGSGTAAGYQRSPSPGGPGDVTRDRRRPAPPADEQQDTPS